jgi:Rod binding domain-containing protein
MKLPPQVSPQVSPLVSSPSHVKNTAQNRPVDVDPELRKAAEGLEAMFTSEMIRAMRDTVEPSEFSLHNSATDIYQSMLDSEYAEISAQQNSLGLSQQIIDYWLRTQGAGTYNK